MGSLPSVALALLLLGQAEAASVRPAPPRAGLAWADADTLSRALQEVEASYRAGKPIARRRVVITERQLNSYLNLTLASQIPAGVTDLHVGLDGEGLRARANVDLDRVPLQRPADGAWSLYSLLTGVVPVALAGRVDSRDGVGTLELTEARLGGWSVPAALVAQLVSSTTKSATNPGGFDIGAPFRLPYAVKRVRFEPGRAVLFF